MGLTYVRATVAKPSGRGRSVEVRFLVDTGAVYTVLPLHNMACPETEVPTERRIHPGRWNNDYAGGVRVSFYA